MDKKTLRSQFEQKRNALPASRREEAKENAFAFFKRETGNILSFASFGSEIDLWLLNDFLAEQGRLLLPKVSPPTLTVHLVHSTDELFSSHFGILEPKEEKEVDEIDLVLVPGLVFDRRGYRIGYGKGYYDRLLEKVRKENQHARILGVAFKEQLIEGIPINRWDQSVDSVHTF